MSCGEPPYWGAARGFNPFYVRANASAIARSIEQALRRRAYEPRPSILIPIEKADGATRKVQAFQVADSSISTSIFKSLLAKNVGIMSGSSYAYRSDRTGHDAIRRLRSELELGARHYVAEYDLSRFFESVRHSEVVRAMTNSSISITDLEQHVIEAFLRCPSHELQSYDESASPVDRDVGIPQGTSLSLFLSNLVASRLDAALESLGVSFARYSDDLLVWGKHYGAIAEASEVVHREASILGSDISVNKSRGIRLLQQDELFPSEIPSTDHVEFLGYRVHPNKTSLTLRAVEGFKGRVEHLIYRNLLAEPQRGTQNLWRISNKDRDYVVLISQLRRLIYGDLSESAVRSYGFREPPRRRYSGFLASHPMVDDDRQLMDLDGWLLAHLELAVKKRRVLLGIYGPSLPVPFGLTQDGLLTATTISNRTGAVINLRPPSLAAMSALLRRAVAAHGVWTVGRRPVPHY